MISSGYVYSDWPEFEDYINAVLKKVIPRELEKDTVIHDCLIKEGNYNASMTAGGYAFVNIGLFSYINDETSLAAVLAHELAHYSRQHSLETGRIHSSPC